VLIGHLLPNQVPSFLIESLVYGVEDVHFLVDSDDRYDRILRIVNRILLQSLDTAWPPVATEINEIKLLLHSSQPWSLTNVRQFAAAARKRLVGG
jgi:hypothetical protein